MNITVNDAIVVALFSAIIGFIIQLFFKFFDKHSNVKALEIAIQAEIKAIILIIEKRNYKQILEHCLMMDDINKNSPTLTIDFAENYNQIYINNLDKISYLGSHIHDVVLFHILISSLIQDAKSGGILNDRDIVDTECYKECLDILDQVITLGEKITSNPQKNALTNRLRAKLTYKKII